jgi:hypothetical protein
MGKKKKKRVKNNTSESDIMMSNPTSQEVA